MVSQPDVTSDLRFAAGTDLYAKGRFYESHEVLEDLWRGSQPRDRLFIQGIIHLTVAFHHWSIGNRTGTLLQLDKCARKLAGYLPQYLNVDTGRMYKEVTAAAARVRDGGKLQPIRIY
jgi:predicted metal-dependent hydrolase